MVTARVTSVHLALLLASCTALGLFFTLLNPAELGFTTPDNSLQFEIDPAHPTYLVKSENIVTTGRLSTMSRRPTCRRVTCSTRSPLRTRSVTPY